LIFIYPAPAYTFCVNRSAFCHNGSRSLFDIGWA
jgi:hypothetical protein